MACRASGWCLVAATGSLASGQFFQDRAVRGVITLAVGNQLTQGVAQGYQLAYACVEGNDVLHCQ